MKTILITRPQPDADTTAAKLQEMGLEAHLDPLLEARAVKDQKQHHTDWVGIVLTSANALRHAAFLEQWTHLPCFAVGEHTASIAQQAGFKTILHENGDASTLAATAKNMLDHPAAPLLWLCGEQQARDLVQDFASQDIVLHKTITYTMMARQSFSPRTLSLLRENRIDATLQYSPRSAEAFIRAAENGQTLQHIQDMTHLCLSRNIAEVFTRHGANRTIVSTRPEEAALLSQLESLYPLTNRHKR